MLTENCEQAFARADRYYQSLAAAKAAPRVQQVTRRPQVRPGMVAALAAGIAVVLSAVYLGTPPAAAAPAARLAMTKPAVMIAPTRLGAEAAAYRQRAARAAAQYRPKPRPKIALAAAVQPSGYANPLRAVTGLYAQRIDAGVDYGGYGPVYAVGPGVIQATYNSGWPGGGWICEYLTAGPDAGSSVYVAEGVTADVGVGAQVNSLTVIGTMWGGIETGFAQPGCAGNALDGYYGYPTPAGYSYSHLLASLGAPGGIG